MNQLATISPALALPALIAVSDESAQRRFLEFFAVTIRNPNTRRAYARACGEFLGWCEARGVSSMCAVDSAPAEWLTRRSIDHQFHIEMMVG